jgi:RNA polymerase sigma factor (sigma-70 family)
LFFAQAGIKHLPSESYGKEDLPDLMMVSLPHFEREALPHLGAAYNLAYWLLRNHADADDVVQDAYLRAFRAADKRVGADIKPWLLAIVRNVAYRWLDLRRRRSNVISFETAQPGRDREMSVLDVASEEPSPEEMLVGRAEQALVRRALAELPPAFREVIVLREFEELRYQEIAEVTGVPMGTVMSRLARARDQLRERLGELLAKENKNAL